MNDARVSKAFLQNFRILLKKVDAEVIVMVCVFENWACYLFSLKYTDVKFVFSSCNIPLGKTWTTRKKMK